MKKIISVFLIALTLLLLPSCDKDIDYDEAEVKAAAVSLIKESEIYNDIFWGDGIRYLEDNNYRNGNYYAADIAALDELGFKKIEDIYSGAAKVFSSEYLEDILVGVFGIKNGEFFNNGLVRYYQETEYIMVYANYKPLLVDEVKYLYDTVEVLGADGDVVSVKITVKVTRGEDTQTRDKTIDLVKEGDRWLLDSPTYTSFRPTELQ